jgi:hypothetical protein
MLMALNRKETRYDKEAIQIGTQFDEDFVVLDQEAPVARVVVDVPTCNSAPSLIAGLCPCLVVPRKGLLVWIVI